MAADSEPISSRSHIECDELEMVRFFVPRSGTRLLSDPAASAASVGTGGVLAVSALATGESAGPRSFSETVRDRGSLVSELAADAERSKPDAERGLPRPPSSPGALLPSGTGPLLTKYLGSHYSLLFGRIIFL